MGGALLVGLLLAAGGDAATRWTPGDVALEAAFAAAVIVDCTQTRWALANGYEERNPLMGRRPSTARLAASGAGVVAGHVLVSAVLPRRWRRWWQGMTLTAELGAVGWNASVGVALEF